jgi:hypothetical protein
MMVHRNNFFNFCRGSDACNESYDVFYSQVYSHESHDFKRAKCTRSRA